MPVLASGLFAAEEAKRSLPMPDWLYGVLAFAVFLLVLGITWSFRNTAARAPRRARGGQSAGGQH
jgi:hypothetical protein